MLRRMPLRCSNAGVWVAPAHTNTWSARTTSCSDEPSGRVSLAARADDAVAAAQRACETRQSAMTRAPASIARGSSVRAIVCFTARPLGS